MVLVIASEQGHTESHAFPRVKQSHWKKQTKKPNSPQMKRKIFDSFAHVELTRFINDENHRSAVFFFPTSGETNYHFLPFEGRFVKNSPCFEVGAFIY
jgi:hypothetical protein